MFTQSVLNSQMQRTPLTATTETSRPYFNLATQDAHFESPQTEFVQNRIPSAPSLPFNGSIPQSCPSVAETSQTVMKSTSSTQQMRFPRSEF